MIPGEVTTWLVVETIDNRVRDISAELAGTGARLEQLGCRDIRYLIPCAVTTPSIERFTGESRFPVHILLHPDLRFGQPVAIGDFIRESSSSGGPSLSVFTDSICGTPAAACVAAGCGLAFIPRVISIDADEGDILFSSRNDVHRTTRKVSAVSESAVITVAPGAFPSAPEVRETSGNRPVIHKAEGSYPWHPVSLSRSPGGAELKEARIIIAVGRGIGSADGLQVVNDLVDVLPGSAVAGSRPVCDAGWLPLSSQVGMTGQTVRPDLYMACGISGSTQHLAGMMDSGCIVAVNSDPDAPFFSVADYCVVEDLAEFLPALIKELKTAVPGKDGDNT